MKDLSKLSDEELNLMGSTQTASLTTMSDEELQKIAGGEFNETPTPQTNFAGMAGMGAAVGGGLYGLGRLWNVPKRQVRGVERQLLDMEKQIPSELSPATQRLPSRAVDVPSRIERQLSESRLAIKDFDDLTLASSAEDLAATVKSAFPKFRESNYQSYGNAVKTAEGVIAEAGKTLDTLGFDKNVIEKTLSDLEFSVPKEQLNSLKPMFREGLEKEISLGQAKKYVNNVAKDLPPDAQRALQKNWGQYLEDAGTPKAKQILAGANKKYRLFLEQDAALRKLIDPKTGDYDYDKLYKYTIQRAKTRINSDFKKLMSDVSEVEPKIGSKAQNLYKLRIKRVEMQRTLNSLRKWLNKAEELVSKRAGVIEKHPIRLGGMAKAMGRGAGTLGRAILFRGMPTLATGGLETRLQDALFQQYFGRDVLGSFEALRGKDPLNAVFGESEEDAFRKFLSRGGA